MDELSLGALLDAPLVDAFSTATPDPLPESDANEARSSLQSRASSGSGVTNSGSAAGVRGSAAASELGGAPSNGAPTNAIPETFASLSGQGAGGTLDSGSDTGAAVNSGGSAGSDEAIQPTSGGDQSATSASPTNDSNSQFGTLSNNPPTAVDDSYSITHDDTLTVAVPGVLGNDTDNVDFDPLTAVLDTGPSSSASFTFNSDGSFEYVPNEHFKGEDSFTYYAHDGTDLSQEVATVTINVTNTAPAAMDDSYATTRNGTLTVAPADGVLNNDTDNVEFDPLTAELDTGPTNGSFNYFNSDGSFEYVPNLGFVGTDSFTYYANDGVENSLTPATVTITVTNTAPVAVDDTYEVIIDGTLSVSPPGVMMNDSDANGDALTAVLDTGPTDGTLTTSGGLLLSPGDSFDGGFIYVPDPGFVGSDTFTYHVTDGLAASNVATVSLVMHRVSMTAFRPTTAPFGLHPVPDAVEDAIGAGVRINGDDDDDDGFRDGDTTDPIVPEEDDLIQVRLEIAGGAAPGVEHVLKRGNTDINIFSDPIKSLPVLDSFSGNETVLTFTGPTRTVWVEMPNGGDASLEFIERNATTGATVDSDLVKFYPFRAIVIVLGGEFQVPSDPVNPDHGTFEIGLRLYRDGYDAYLHGEYDVSPMGVGPAFDEVVEAIQLRGVNQAVIFGFSHGGGSTYFLADRLDTWSAAPGTDPFVLAYTGYIDAVRNDSLTDIRQETRRPPGTAYHANYYQPNGILEPGGGPMGAFADFELNVGDVAHTEVEELAVVQNGVYDRIDGSVDR